MEILPLQKKKKVNVNRVIFIIAGISLPILSFLVFWVYVNFSSIILAFQDSRTGAWTMDNFRNFWFEFTKDGGEINVAFKNTMVYFAQDIILLFVNLAVAFILYKKVFMHKTFRVLFYLPAIISGVVMVTVFSEFVKPQGPFGIIMEKLGHPIPPEGLLSYSPKTATGVIIAYGFWVGLTGMLLFHGSLARIPVEVIEAARLDGCKPFKELTSIIFPMIWPMFSTVVIFQMTGLFSASGPILLFTGGVVNTDYGVSTLSYWMFQQVYGGGTYGGTGAYGAVSAKGLVFTAIGVPIILLTRWLVEKVPTVEY